MDGARSSGWMLWVAVLALIPVVGGMRGGGTPGAPVRAEEKGAGEARQEPKEPARPVSPWDGPALLVSRLTGEVWDGKGDGRERWLGLAAQVKAARFKRFDPLIALVPCPVDSNLAADFDQALSAIQEAYADAGYLLEGWWLPWTGDPEKDRVREQAPGLLIFRRFSRPERAAVLVVGEVPAEGIHRATFREAVRGIRRWAQDWEPKRPVTVRVVGPTLSDSALSLRLAILELKDEEAAPTFEVVTGSARARRVSDRRLWRALRPGTSFHSTVVGEDELQVRARLFLQGQMHWNLDEIALLTESDTAYGQPFLTPENLESSVLVRFPPGIAGVRNAWDQDQRPPQPSPGQGMVQVPETTLDLRLGDRGRPVLVPELSTTTAASRDLAIANLLATLSDRKIRYIGILAHDARDAAFLVDRVRRFAPSALVFLVENNLVYTHPRLGPTMNGTLVIGSFPLFAGEGPDVPAPFQETPRQYLSQFTSDLHQGIYLAARRLIATSRGERPPVERRQVWVSAVGNGSLWPIAALDGTIPGEICPLLPWSSQAAGAGRLSERASTKLLVSAVVILLLTLLLERFANPPRIAGPRAWWLLAAVASLLGLAVGMLVVLGTLPYRRLNVRLGGEDLKQAVAGLLLTATAAALAAIVARVFSREQTKARRLALFGGVALGALLVLFGIDQALCHLWFLGRFELFLRRAFTLSSSLSPLVSLAWLAGGFYLWAFIELRRARMQARQRVDWPGSGPTLPSFERCRAEADQLEMLLDGPWPRWTGLRSLWVLVLPIVLFACLNFVAVRPVTEPRAYGRLFLFLLGFTFFLGSYSFCRFLAAWMTLQRILSQIALPHPPRGLDKALADLVSWSPMKSFGWQIPHFRMATLVADQIRSLAKNGKLSSGLPARTSHAIERAVAAQRDRAFESEIQARDELRTILAEADRELKGWRVEDPDVERFVTLRLVAYIRYVFAHLRGCLIAAGACGFLLLAAASTYAFEPNEFITNWIWTSLLVAVLVTLVVFLQMDRDEVLSRISGTPPQKIQVNRQLVTNFLTYGAVPLIGLIASQFPQVGRYLVGLANPLLKVVGGP